MLLSIEKGALRRPSRNYKVNDPYYACISSLTLLIFAKNLLQMTLHVLICRFSLRFSYFMEERELKVKKY